MPNNVELIDPIQSINRLPNGTPNYEDLFIFAEILGERRERSILTLSNNDNKTTLSTQFTNANVNMLGVDFNENKVNSARFTTNWTNNESDTTTLLEGFGINKIDVTVDSSYIPKVNVEFVDIRGATFFNLGDDSPYSLIFDLPPPLFKMTLKGYYGKSLDYDLHLLKHHTRFNGDDGNYYINVEFVARTFAPLADIPFKFTEVVGLMAKPTEPSPDDKSLGGIDQNINPNKLNTSIKVEPKNTFELIGKLKRLTDELKDVKNTSEEGKFFDEAKQALENGKEIQRYISSFKSEIGDNYRNKSEIIIKNDNLNSDEKTRDNDGDFTIINGVELYDNIIKESNTDGDNSATQNNRLYLGVKFETVRDGNNVVDENAKNIQEADIVTKLKVYSKKLTQKGVTYSNENISENIIKEPKKIYNYSPDGLINSTSTTKNYDTYYAIDITDFYYKVRKTINKKIEVVDKSQQNLVKLVNSTTERVLGFRPTIYNIFKVLCDDLDNFFRVLGSVSKDAERHHNQYFNQLVDRVKEIKSKNITKKLYPFPLYVERDVSNCNVVRDVRRIPPINLVKDENMPEVSFVTAFINTMVLLRKLESVNELKTKIDVNGNNKWIPITPADSVLYNGGGYNSPYVNIENISNENTDSIIDSLYSKILNRFYIVSQFTYGDSFYSQDRTSTLELKRNDLIKYVAESEAINVANSIINDNVLQSLKDKTFESNIDDFYTQISNLSLYRNIPNDNLKLTTENNTSLYKNVRNSNYNGFIILEDIPTKRVNGDGSSDDPIDKFLDCDIGFLEGVNNFFYSDNENKIKNFTSENIPFFPDTSANSDNKYVTKYLNGLDDIIQYDNIYNFNETNSTNSSADPNGIGSDADYALTLSTILSVYSGEVKTFLESTSYAELTKAFVLASMFGRARSYFSELGLYSENFKFSNKIGSVNSRFLIPAVVEVPQFSVYYMGALIALENDITISNQINTLLNEEWFKKISVNSGYINDDLERIGNLSENDREIFTSTFNRWFELRYSVYKNEIITLISDIVFTNDDASFLLSDAEDKKNLYLNKIKEGGYRSIENDFIKKIAILNFSDYTFNNKTFNPIPTYQPLNLSNADNNKKDANDTYFRAFWSKLKKELPARETEIDDAGSDIESAVDDDDIKTQIYYSFKNISDRWVSGIDTSKRGFPLNNSSNDSLISKFAFVDRAMNSIGSEVIINAESLIEMSKDFDLNMFQVFSRLLSLNGFEFFPLQNFMAFNDKDAKWGDAFEVVTSLDQNATPAFVCMYIGGTSSALENSGSAFDNDGILDFEEEGLQDFSNQNDCNENDEPEEIVDSKNRELKTGEAEFKYSEPKAFRVRFAEQNQSFFTHIDIEGRDFPQTADSLSILSRIAGDGKTSPIPKGQNLFSTYENRAYTVTIRMLGNVMIQPTQYFQLENIPMYSGAYLITKVTHNVTANHMVTTFSGTKILKYPNPFVKDFAIIVGIESGTSEDTSGNRSVTTSGSFNKIGDTISSRTLVEKDSGLYNNSQFDLKISP